MRGDFSRDSFDPLRRFSRVLQQQGRIELDAEANERQSIQLHLLRTLAADIIGRHGGPGASFKLEPRLEPNGQPARWNFNIGRGRYYVEGLPCESDAEAAYRGATGVAGQPWSRPEQPEAGRYLAYLEVWERHVSAAEHDLALDRAGPGWLAEVALGGVDTASRAQMVWQVKLGKLPDDVAVAAPLTDEAWSDLVERWRPSRRGLMQARVEKADALNDPCVVPPNSAYRGMENQLYRVEIARGGRAGDGGATFVWSRENGSVVFPVASVTGRDVVLASAWRDTRFGLAAGDTVELADAEGRLDGVIGSLHRVTGYEGDSATVELETAPAIDADPASGGVILRRWDHVARHANTGTPPIADDGAVQLVEGRWLPLEDGVQIQFAGTTEDSVNVYRAGDYWLIPARTAIGDVIWPRDASRTPLTTAPHGVDRNYAPLGVVTFDADGRPTLDVDLRRTFNPLAA